MALEPSLRFDGVNDSVGLDFGVDDNWANGFTLSADVSIDSVTGTYTIFDTYPSNYNSAG